MADAALDEARAASDRPVAETRKLWRSDRGSLAGLSSVEWKARGDALRAHISGSPGTWQDRDVAAALSAEELHERVRRQEAAKVDVYRFRDGVTVAVVPSEREDDPAKPPGRIFRRVFAEAGKTLAGSLFDVSIGVPVSQLVLLPRDATGAVFYSVSLSALRTD